MNEEIMSHTQTLLFDTLYFANKLKEAGVEPKIAETQAELQAEVQANMQAEMQTKVLDKLSEHEDMLCELTKHELATKEDLHREVSSLENKIEQKTIALDHKIDRLEHRVDTKLEALKSDLILKLGKMMASGITIAVTILGSMITALGILATVLHYVD